jgi:hypothetical protein
VSFALYRRLRRDDLRPTGPSPDDRSSEAAPESDRPLAVHGTDPPE